MSFEQYIAANLSKEDYENLEKHLGSSPHRKTKILRNPKIANNHEVLVFAQLLHCTAYQLYQEFALGSYSLSELKIENHRVFQELKREKLASISGDKMFFWVNAPVLKQLIL